MGFLAGILGGVGQSAGTAAHNLLDIHMQKVKALSDLYSHIASNPNFDPNVQKEAYNRATQITAAGPFDQKTYKQYSKIDDMFNMNDTAKMANLTGQLQSGAGIGGQAGQTQSGQQQPTQDPSGISIPSPYVNGVMDPVAKARFEAGSAAAKTQAEMQTRLQQFSAYRNQYKTQYKGAVASNPLGQQYADDIADHLAGVAVFGRGAAVTPHPPTPATITYKDDNGVMQTKPGWSYASTSGALMRAVSDPTDPSGLTYRLVNADSTLGPQLRETMVNGSPEWASFVPGVTGAIDTGAPAKPIQTGISTTTDKTVNPTDLSQRTVVQQNKQFTPVPGGGVPPLGAAPTAPAAAGATAGKGKGLSTVPAPPKAAVPGIPAGPPANTDRTAPMPNNQEIKAAGGTSEQNKLQAARAGVAHIQKLDSILDSNKALFGPALGRALNAANKLGSGGVINALHTMAYGDNPTLEQQKQFIDNAQNEIAKIAYDKSTPAEVSSELITLMRAINGIEIIAMSGSGNGITRLYQMMHDSMLNPTQSREIIRGHMSGLMDLFAGNMAETMRSRGQGWKDLSPSEQRMFEKYGTAQNYFGDLGYQPSTSPSIGASGNTIVAKAGPLKGQTLYKGPDGNYYPAKGK